MTALILSGFSYFCLVPLRCAGGSLLLVPVACSLFGISNDLAMQVVGVGFILGCHQDLVKQPLTPTDVRLYSSNERTWVEESNYCIRSADLAGFLILEKA